jgi:hypothetical protein
MTVASPSNLYSDLDVHAELDVSLAKHTWFGIGGSGDLPVSYTQLRAHET